MRGTAVPTGGAGEEEKTETSDATRAPHVLVLCTGNVARSVIAGALLESSGAEVTITTAGTHAVERQPISRRTRAALASLGLEAPAHRSRQVSASDLEAADLIVAMEPDHVRYLRRKHPDASGKTATLPWLVANLSRSDQPHTRRWVRQTVAGMDLANVPAELQAEVPDPAGGDEDDYFACARQLESLVRELGALIA